MVCLYRPLSNLDPAGDDDRRAFQEFIDDHFDPERPPGEFHLPSSTLEQFFARLSSERDHARDRGERGLVDLRGHFPDAQHGELGVPRSTAGGALGPPAMLQLMPFVFCSQQPHEVLPTVRALLEMGTLLCNSKLMKLILSQSL